MDEQTTIGGISSVCLDGWTTLPLNYQFFNIPVKVSESVCIMCNIDERGQISLEYFKNHLTQFAKCNTIYLIKDVESGHHECMIWNAPYPEYNASLIFKKYEAAAEIIQRKWLKIYYNPYHCVGRKRIYDEYDTLASPQSQQTVV